MVASGRTHSSSSSSFFRDPLAIVAVVCGLSMLAWMGRAVVTGRIPFTGDLLHFHYPLRDFYARALAAGDAFDWLPGLFNGFFVVGEGQLGAYHPFHWLVYRLLPLDRAFAVDVVAAYPLLFAGVCWWLGPWLGRGPAAVAALLVTSGGQMLTHGVHPNMTAVLAHLPWVLGTLDRAVAPAATRTGSSAAALLAVLVGSQWLLGHPQSVWFTVLASGAYAVWRRRTAASTTRLPVVWLAGQVGGAAVGAVQLLATFDAWRHSTRPAYDAAYASLFSLEPRHWLQLLHPYLAWGRVSRWNEMPGAGDEYGVYVGTVTLTLAVWWLGSAWRERGRDGSTWPGRRLGLGVAAFGAVALWLSMGRTGGLYLIQTWLPVVSGFRAPVRYVFFVQWAAAILAALAIGRLLAPGAQPDARRQKGMAWALAAALLVISVATSWFAVAPLPPPGGEAGVARWWAPAVCITAMVVLAFAVRGVRPATVLLVVLAAIDQGVYGVYGVIAWQDHLTRQQALGYLDTNDFLPAPGPDRLVRGGFPNLYLLGGHRLVDGYVAIEPARALDYRQPAALRLSQVAYAHRDYFAGGSAPEGREMPRGWMALPAPLARVRLTSEIRVSTHPADDLQSIDPARVTLTSRALAVQPGPPGRATLVLDAPGALTIETDAPTGQMLVVSESFHDGWSAAIDGAPARVERVNGDFLGCEVPTGTHRVTMRFRPRVLVAGRWISLVAGCAALALAFGPRRWRPR